MKTYKQESSQLPTERVISINEDECMTYTYAEAEMTEDGRKIRWSPHEINEKSFYSPDSRIFE